MCSAAVNLEKPVEQFAAARNRRIAYANDARVCARRRTFNLRVAAVEHAPAFCQRTKTENPPRCVAAVNLALKGTKRGLLSLDLINL